MTTHLAVITDFLRFFSFLAGFTHATMGEFSTRPHSTAGPPPRRRRPPTTTRAPTAGTAAEQQQQEEVMAMSTYTFAPGTRLSSSSSWRHRWKPPDSDCTSGDSRDLEDLGANTSAPRSWPWSPAPTCRTRSARARCAASCALETWCHCSSTPATKRPRERSSATSSASPGARTTQSCDTCASDWRRRCRPRRQAATAARV